MKVRPEEALPRTEAPRAELSGVSALEVLEALDEGFLALDASLRVCASNRAAEQLLGRPRLELSGQPLSAVLGEPGASPELLEGCRRALAEQVPARWVEHRASVGQWLELRLSPRREQVWLFLRDVTREHQSEQRLKDFERQQAVLRYVIANVPHAIFWKDREGHFLGANQNFISDAGMGTLENLAGKTDYDLWKPEQADFFTQVDRQVMHSGTPMLDIEEPIRRADGSERTLLTSKVPLRDEEGQVTGLLGIYADITERKRAELELEARKRELEETLRRLRATQEQLLQKGKMAAVGSLVAGLCHELNNPMAAIRMSLDLLVRRKLAPERQRETLEVIERQSQRCVSLVKALREFSSRPAIIPEPCEVGAVVDRVLGLAGPRLARRNVSLEARLSATQLPRLHLHGAELESALLHVVTNALEASPEGGTVLIEARPLAREGMQGVEVAVIDSGPGISPDMLPHVIEPFFTTKPPGEGTGLGLALTHRFLDAHGGTLNIQSELGRGTAVRMWLPAAPVLEAAVPAGGEASLQ